MSHDATTFGVDEFACRIGKTVDWVYRHVGEVPHVRIGRSLRFTDSDVAVFINRRRVDPDRVLTTSKVRR